uniref:GTP-binding protein Rhes n=1 Tax=Ascaris suum TaxID=6253 RepID=F1LBX4_ASCSU
MPAKTYRLIVLGSAKVGKTSIIRRFFYEEFSDKYKETIEDLHSRNFKIQGTQLSLEILDTNFNFPDMRKLAVASADSFMLVFAVDDIQSFKEMSELWTELCERRTDIRQLPIVIVGNKSDLSSKKIYEATATAWTSRLNANVRYVEASAKTAQNVASIFKSLLELSDFSHIKVHAGGLESSTHGSDQDPLDSKCQLSWPSSSSLVTPMPDMELKRNRSLRVKGACEKKLPLERHTNDEEMTSLQRSNSLIRRTKHLSLRVRAHGNRAVEGTSDQENDCKIT